MPMCKESPHSQRVLLTDRSHAQTHISGMYYACWLHHPTSAARWLLEFADGNFGGVLVGLGGISRVI